MIIPVKCVTCGNVLADKYRFYLEQVKEKKLKKKGTSVDKVVYLTQKHINREDSSAIEKTAEGLVMDQLKLHNLCCRRTMMTHVDIL